MELDRAQPTDGLAWGIVAHTTDNPTRRYFEPHSTQDGNYEYRGRGEIRRWDDLRDPRRYATGCEVRP